MRAFGWVVGPHAPGRRGAGQLQLTKSSRIGRVLVRDPLVRRYALLLQQLAHELASRLRVALGLEEHIQTLAFCVHSPSEIHLLAIDTDAHLVEMPSSMRPRAS